VNYTANLDQIGTMILLEENAINHHYNTPSNLLNET